MLLGVEKRQSLKAVSIKLATKPLSGSGRRRLENASSHALR
jgi:hypothetical protein